MFMVAEYSAHGVPQFSTLWGQAFTKTLHLARLRLHRLRTTILGPGRHSHRGLARMSQRSSLEVPMSEAISIVFRAVPPSPTLEATIRRKSERLLRLHRGLSSCRTTVQSVPTHHNTGHAFSVRIELHIPGAELVIDKDHAPDGEHENAYVATRDAFRAAKRVLQQHLRKHRSLGREHIKVAESLVDGDDDDLGAVA
jgi:hypothetical protein